MDRRNFRSQDRVAVQRNRQPVDIFHQFNKMSQGIMSRFGMGFGQDRLFREGGGIRDLMGGFGGMGNIFQFSDLHDNMMGFKQSSKPFTMVSQTYVSSSKMGPDGKMYQQKYMTNNVARKGQDGHVISEGKQAYRNSNGIDRIGHEKMLNDKGRKVVKERNRATKEQNETNHFHNMDYDQIQDFDNRWNAYSQKSKFIQDYGQYRDMPRIDYQPKMDHRQTDYGTPYYHNQPQMIQPQRRKDIHPTMPSRNIPIQQERAPVRPVVPRQAQLGRHRETISRGSHQNGLYKNTLGRGKGPTAG